MAKYQQYAEYKDSGVEWLGEIPNSWIATNLKRYCQITDGSHHSPSIESEGLPFVSVTDVGINEINFIDAKKISNQAFLRLVKEGCKPSIGDILLTKDGTIGRACIITEEMPEFVILSSLGLITPSKHLINKYLYYFLISGINIDQMNSVIHGSALRRMTISKINDLVLVYPLLKTEQTQIANFLDHETAKIDSLIEKQQQLIQLLKEKRQAVISHAVTKGLDPNVPMKDSGVEWLGQVPEHWKICSLSKIFSIKAGGDVQTRLFSEIQTDEHKFPIYTNANNANSIYGYSKIANYSANSITVSGRGDVGFAVYRDHAFDAIIRLLVLTPQKTCYTKYFAYFINEVIDFKVESSAIGQLSTLQISPYKILFPPFDEQKLITEYLDNETIKIDALIHKAESVIQLMQERRTVLISSAVTGKIDVRNWQNPTEAKMEFSA